MTAAYRYKKANELLERAYSLSEKLLTDEDYTEFAGYQGNPEQATLFEQRKLNRTGEFQDLLLDARSFIKISYGPESEYLTQINSVDYLTQHRGYLTDSFNINQNTVWASGRHKLISLLTTLIFEEKQRKEMEAHFDNSSRTTVLRVGVTALLAVGLLALWNVPQETMLHVFGKDKVFMARCGLSVSLVPLYLIAFSPKDWITLLSVWATLFVVVIGFLR